MVYTYIYVCNGVCIFYIEPSAKGSEIDPDLVWARLLSFRERGWVVSRLWDQWGHSTASLVTLLELCKVSISVGCNVNCTFHSFPMSASCGGEGEEESEYAMKGLESNHAYSILDIRQLGNDRWAVIEWYNMCAALCLTHKYKSMVYS